MQLIVSIDKNISVAEVRKIQADIVILSGVLDVGCLDWEKGSPDDVITKVTVTERAQHTDACYCCRDNGCQAGCRCQEFVDDTG